MGDWHIERFGMEVASVETRLDGGFILSKISFYYCPPSLSPVVRLLLEFPVVPC